MHPGRGSRRLVPPGRPRCHIRDFLVPSRCVGEPGIRVRAARLLIYEHFAIRVGRGGHPALRNKLVRQAIAYGIDRAHVREAAARGGVHDGRRARQPRPPEAEPSLPAELGDLSLPSRRGSQVARARGVSHRSGRRLRLRGRAALAPLRDERGDHDQGADSLARSSSAEASRDRGQADVRSGTCVHRPGAAERRLRRRPLRVGRRPDVRRRGRVPLRRLAELRRVLPAAGDARSRPGRANPRRARPCACPQPSRRPDGEGRAGDPALSAVVHLVAQDEPPRRRPLPPQSALGCGELVARGPG